MQDKYVIVVLRCELYEKNSFIYDCIIPGLFTDEEYNLEIKKLEKEDKKKIMILIFIDQHILGNFNF